jgi:DNA-binding transcriptional regulator YhcF (GntR family)
MARRLDLFVDRESEVPLGTQLVWKLRTLIATGVLQPGARVPGIRELAESAGVNVNTVRAVFARLEEQGLLATEHGRGTFVADGVRADAILAEMARAAIAQAAQAGVDPRELAAALFVATGVPAAAERSPAAADRSPAAAERAERRALRAEIERLERELAHLDRLGPLVEPPGEAAPRVLTAAELRDVRDDVARRVEELREGRRRRAAGSAGAGSAGADAAEAEAVGSGGAGSDIVPADARKAQREAPDSAPAPAPPDSARAPAPRWPAAGVWTGRPAADVAWTGSS